MGPKHAIAALAGLLLVVLGAWVLRALFPLEWEAQQHAYNAARERAGLEPVPIGVRALQGASCRGQERCVTCHLGTVLQPLNQVPFHSHPQVTCSLPIEVQGCTGCHGGEALRVTKSGAHGDSEDARRTLVDGADPALRHLRIQSGCAGCHSDRSAGVLRYDEDKVPEVAAGMRLFLEQGCWACHRIAGVSNATEQAPELTVLAQTRTRSYVHRLLEQPGLANPTSPMPPLIVDPKAREQLVTFLMSLIGPEDEGACGATCVRFAIGSHPALTAHFEDGIPDKPNPAAGALWAHRAGCGGCHRTSADAKGVPDLTRVAWFRPEDYLRRMLRNPRSLVPRTLMPTFELPEPIRESMVQWLALQKAPLPSSAPDVFRDVCRRCHGRERDPKVVVLSTRPPVLEGNAAHVPRERFIDVATKGVEGTAMAPWGRLVSPTFLGAIYDKL